MNQNKNTLSKTSRIMLIISLAPFALILLAFLLYIILTQIEAISGNSSSTFADEDYQIVFESVWDKNFVSGGLEKGVLLLFDSDGKKVYEDLEYPLNSSKTMVFERDGNKILFLKKRFIFRGKDESKAIIFSKNENGEVIKDTGLMVSTIIFRYFNLVVGNK